MASDEDRRNAVTYPAITLWQPWATWIADGLKVIETRTHARFRCLVGHRIAIHAGRRWDDTAIRAAMWVSPVGWWAQLKQSAQRARSVRGMVVCTATVRDFQVLHEGHSPAALINCRGTHRYGLFLQDVRPVVPPVPARGHQGIWQWNPQGQEIVK
ncbi:MAG TPA: hypothetical protein VMZ50_11730 [Phycisphaerae bacterium]|nr:hypothetical protein [Phycisphaerae bacterium]